MRLGVLARLAAIAACLVASGFVVETVVHADSPATIAVGTNPIFIATTPDGTKAYVSNYSSNSVSVIDIATNLVTATIASVPEPIGIAISPDGTKAYVANYPNSVRTSATITVINTATNTVTGTISVGPQPRFIAFSPDGTKAYVAHITTTVSVIDVATSAVASTWTLPSTIYGIVLSPDGSKAYLSRVNSTSAGWVSVVNTSNGTVASNIAVGPSPQTLTINAAGTKVYVPNNGTDRVNTTVSVITTATNAVATITVGQGPRQVKISPDGSKAYVTNQAAGTVSIINTSTNAVTDTITVGTAPMGIAFSSDGSKAYVTNYSSNTVSILVPAYPITYNGNGSTGGTAPASGSYTAGSSAYTILGNTGSLVKTDYWFAGWNTLADGSGTTYGATSSYSTAVNLTLYARWLRADSVTATVTVGTNPYAVAITPDSGRAYVTNTSRGNTISIINTATSAVTGSITVGTSPVGIAITPDGTKAYVAHYVSPVSTVKVIDIASGAVTKTITVGQYAMWVAISPDGTKAYVTNYGDTTVSVINTSTDTVVATINVGGANVKGIAFTPDGTKAYVTRGGGTGAGSISVIDTATNAVTATITAGINAWNLAITPDGTRAYVPNLGANNVDVISTATNTITATIPVGVAPRSVAISPDGTKAFVTNQTSGTTSVIDTASNMVIGTLTVGATPVGVAFTPDGSKAYVANHGSATVSVFNWAASTYSIAYNSNGSTGGTVPATGSYTTGGSEYTVSGNTGLLVKTGSTFSGWNTLANGTGTAYAAASSYSTSATATLYAQWTADALPYSEPFGTSTGSSTGTQASTGLTVGAFATFPNWTKAGSPNPTHWVDVDSGAAVNYAVSLMQSNTLTMTTGLAANVLGTTYRVAYDAGPSTWNTIGEATDATDGLVLSVLRADSTTLQSSTILPGAWSGLSTAQTLNARCFTYVGDGSGSVKLKIATVNASAGRFGGAIDNIAIDAGACPTYSVTYAANGSTGGAVPTDAGAYAAGASVTVLGNTGTLVRTGYTFAGWNSAADGSGTSYAPAATPVMGSGNITLYARWTAVTYAVSYAANGSTGGAVPTDAGAYAEGASVTVLGNTGTLVRTGYTFAGWNSAPAGSGSSYAGGSSLAVGSEDVTLYAKWTAVSYAVTYSANGATGGAVPADGTFTTGGSAYAVPGNTGGLTRTGFVFSGWNTAADGSGTAYAASSSYSTSAGVMLHARWSVATYGVTYAVNGATAGSVPVDAGAYAAGASATVLGNSGSLARIGYAFSTWNTSADGSGTAYAAGAALTMGSAGVTLYAQWTAVIGYSITYNGNGSTGGSGPVDGGSYASGASATLAASGSLARTGYSFATWNTAADGSGTSYAVGATLTMGSANATLYARWTALTYAVAYGANGATGGSVPASGSFTSGGTGLTVSGNSGLLANAGYTFSGWNTAADGSGSAYAEGSSYSTSIVATLNAQWTLVGTYAISFGGNGSTGGSVPASGSYTPGGAAYPVAGNTGSLVRAGYAFGGWNTAADGSGTAYATGASYAVSSSATLLAQWTAATYAITFAGNGATGGSAPAGASFTTGGSAFTVPGNTGSLSRSGYTFAGWDTAADGSGTAYATGSSLSPGAATTLFGQWTAVPVVIPTPASSPAAAGSGPSSPSPTPATTTAAISYANLNPIPHEANRNIPAAGVPAGGFVVLMNGNPIAVTVKPNAPTDPTSLIVSGSGFTMEVEGRSGAADSPAVTASGALILYSVQPEPRASALTSGVRTSPWKFGAAMAPSGSPQPMAMAAGTGFRAGSPVRFYILPSISMGELTVDASGRFAGEVPVPMGIATGPQTLQVNGYAPDGSIRSLSLGVVVKAPGTAIATRQAKALVKFAPKSSTLTKAGKARLRALVRRTGPDGDISVTGFARGKNLTHRARALSDARAKKVASYLRKVGLKGGYTVRGVWVVGGPKVTGQRVSVVVVYPRR